ADFPLADPAPVNRGDTYGNPRNAYSLVETSLMNPNGIVAAIDSAGVYGHSEWNTIYYSQRNSDGSWGSPVVMWRGSTQFGQGPVIGGASITGINKLNQVLGWVQPDGNYAVPQPVLYDINSRSLINLASYLASQPQPYHDIRPIALDDQGRILLQAGF